MQIDLFTFIAQIANFVILILLLYHFLFKKIIRAIDEREETIRNEFTEAEAAKQTAEQDKKDYERQLRNFEEQKEKWQKEAQAEIYQGKKELLEEAKRSIEQRKKDWESKLEREKELFLTTFKEAVAHEVYNTADALVQDLATADVDRMLFTRFLTILRTLPEEQKQEFQSAYVERNKDSFQISSSFPLLDEEKKQLEELLSEILATSPAIVYEEERKDFWGIELKFGSFRFSFSSTHYLEKLEETYKKVLTENHV